MRVKEWGTLMQRNICQFHVLLISVAITTLILPYPVLAVSLDNVTTGSTSTSPLTISHTVTASGGNRAIFLHCVLRSKTVTLTATYNDTEAAFVRSDINPGSTELSTWVFRQVAPTTGTHDWVVTQSANTIMGCYARSATDVDQTTPISDSDGVCANLGSSATVTLTSTGSDLLLDVLGRSAVTQALAQGANQTDEFAPFEVGGNTSVGGSRQLGSDGGEMSWGWSSSGGNCISAINIQHSAYVAPSFGPLRRRGGS
jgi:hypothetical protein